MNRSGAVSQLAVGVQGDIASDASNFLDTAEAVATDRILFTSGNPNKTAEMIQEEALNGEIGRGTPERGLEESVDSIDCIVPYTYKDTDFISTDALIAAFMGAETFEGDTSEMTQITLSDSSIYALTLAYIYGTVSSGQLVIAQGAVPTSMEISCEMAGKLSASFDFVGYDIAYSTNDSTNSKSAIDSIPHIGHTNAMGHHMTFRIQSTDGSLGDTEKKKISSFTLSCDKNFDTDSYATTDNSNHTNAQKIIAPIVDGRRDSTLEFEVPRYDAQTYIDWMNGGTPLNGDITITDGTDTIQIYMPNIVIDNVDKPIDGSGAITQTVSALLSRRDVEFLSDGNMQFSDTSTNIDKEFAIELDNDRSAAIL